MKTILITGATSGIGYGLAKAYLKLGHRVIAIGRSKEKLLEMQNNLSDILVDNPNLVAQCVDVKDKIAMETSILGYENQYGLDVVIANAGISSGVLNAKDFDEIGREIYNVNVFGVFNTINPIVDIFKAKEKGHLVVISSMSAFLPMKSALFYASSKSAISSWGLGLKMLLHPFKVDVSVVYPGFVYSNITKNNKFKMPFIMDSDKSAEIIIKALEKKKSFIVFPKLLYFIIYFISILPYGLKEKILLKLPNK